MKKITILFLSLLLSGGLFAQMPSFGIKAGATAATLNTSDLAANSNPDNLLGYQAGFFMRLNSGKLYLQPELVYNNRKANWVSAALSDNKFETGTLDVPILVGFKLLDAKVFNLRVFAGPEASLKMNEKTISDGYTINKTNWFMQAGAGIDFLFLTFDIRYEKGLSQFIEDASGANKDFKNNVWVFSLGLKFM